MNICDLSINATGANDRQILSLQADEQLGEESRSDRLDSWLSEQLPNLSRSRIQKIIKDGGVTLNGAICKAKKTQLKPGDYLQITIPAAQPLELEPEEISLDILYEDDQLLIINKPAGMVVHPAPGHHRGTLVNALLAYCPDSLAGIGGMQRPGIVHRLDKDTTGAIAIAKTDPTHQHLQAQIKAKTGGREYLGVVYGAPREPSGTINLPIGRHPVDRKKQAIVPIEKGGKVAITHWQIQERIGNYTLIHYQLETGRTHQIRVHSAQIGHPIVGDKIYGKGKSVGVNLPGQALHAWRLTLQHPVTEQTIQVCAPLPKTFQTLLEVLRQRRS